MAFGGERGARDGSPPKRPAASTRLRSGNISGNVGRRLIPLSPIFQSTRSDICCAPRIPALCARAARHAASVFQIVGPPLHFPRRINQAPSCTNGSCALLLQATRGVAIAVVSSRERKQSRGFTTNSTVRRGQICSRRLSVVGPLRERNSQFLVCLVARTGAPPAENP